MKKNFERHISPSALRIESLMKQDWICLGSRVPYWAGSPWRALGQLRSR